MLLKLEIIFKTIVYLKYQKDYKQILQTRLFIRINGVNNLKQFNAKLCMCVYTSNLYITSLHILICTTYNLKSSNVHRITKIS